MNRTDLSAISSVYALADDDPRWRHRPRVVIDSALEAGASVVQLRFKHSSDRDSLELTRWAVQRTSEAGALLFVNDRVDLASIARADGVHLGTEDLPPEDISADIRANLLIGLSTHTLDQVRKSIDRPVDYIGFGPLFGTQSKESEYSARGLELLEEAVALAKRPVIAIGGIDMSNIRGVARKGAAGAAIISAICNADDPTTATAMLGQAFRDAQG